MKQITARFDIDKQCREQLDKIFEKQSLLVIQLLSEAILVEYKKDNERLNKVKMVFETITDNFGRGIKNDI